MRLPAARVVEIPTPHWTAYDAGRFGIRMSPEVPMTQQERGWTSALVVSEDPGHLMMTALCDANCCVDLGRLTLREWEVMPDYFVKAGHYALIPPSAPNTDAECTFIAGKIMCLNIDSRRACKDDFQLGP